MASGPMGAPTPRTSTTRPCEACRSLISAEATLCPECGSFRAQWKNRLRYWSGVVGLIAFISSAALLIYQAMAIGRTRAFGADVQVLDLDTFGNFTLFNDSPSEILVRRVSIAGTEFDLELVYVVNESVEPGGTLGFNMIEAMQKQTHGTWAEIYGARPGDYAFELSEQERDDLIESIHDIYVPTFLNARGTSQSFFLKETADATPFGCTIVVHYTVFQGGEFPHNVPCHAWARVRSAAQGGGRAVK